MHNLADAALSRVLQVGNCKDDDIVQEYFGDATLLAQAIENGEKRAENVVYDPQSRLLIKYDLETDIHFFYCTMKGNQDEKPRIQSEGLSISQSTERRNTV
jgi:hypothetical protein